VIVSLIAAVAENGVIGRDGTLPWSLPADLRRFRDLTTGHHVVMGRKTHASIGRALPDRVNLVLTRTAAAVAPGCRAVPSLAAALEVARDAGESEVFVIGGAAVYALALPLAARIYLTRVVARVDGDVRFPELDAARWVEVSREVRAADERNAHALAFTVLQAAGGASSAPPAG
jgi:dihydrofolate reductase